jgi:hypothetical protein
MVVVALVVVVAQAALMPKVHSKVVIEQVGMMIQMQVSLMKFLAPTAVVGAAVEEEEGIEEEATVAVGEDEEEEEEEQEGCTVIIVFTRHPSHCHHWVEEGHQGGLVERSMLILCLDKTAIDVGMSVCVHLCVEAFGVSGSFPSIIIYIYI